MAKLYGGLSGMLVVFAAAMTFATLAVYEDQWWWGVVAAGVMVVFAAIGGAVVPTSMRALSDGALRAAKAFLQLFGSMCGLLFFTMALVSWILGKRYLGSNSAYTALGILIFLGFAGVGLQGALAMAGYFVHVRNQAVVIPARVEATDHGGADHDAHHGAH